MKKLTLLAAFAYAAAASALNFGPTPSLTPLLTIGEKSLYSSSVPNNVSFPGGAIVQYLGIVDSNYASARHSWRVTLQGGTIDGGIYASGDLYIVVNGDTTLECNGNTSGIEASSYGAVHIQGSGKLRIECERGTGIYCRDAHEVDDIQIKNACVEYVRTASGVGTSALGSVGYGIYTTGLSIQNSTVTIYLNDGLGDAIRCETLDASKSLIMACGGKRGLYAKGKYVILQNTKASKTFSKKPGNVRINGGGLCVQGSAVGAAIGDYEHIGTADTYNGSLFMQNAVLVASGLTTDGVCCGGNIVLDNVSGSVRAAQCALRAFDDIDYKGKGVLSLVGNIAGDGSDSKIRPGLGTAMLTARTGAKTGTGGGTISISGGELSVFAPGGVGIFTPGVFSLSGGKVTIASGAKSQDQHAKYTEKNGTSLRNALNGTGGISLTSKEMSALSGLLRYWKQYGDNTGNWSPTQHGIDAQVYKQTNGDCAIRNASEYGILLGWKYSGSSTSSTAADRTNSGRLTMSGGTLAITEPSRTTPSFNTCLSSFYTTLTGTGKMKFSGGHTTLVGGNNCLVCNNDVIIKNGTLEYYVRRATSTPSYSVKGDFKGIGIYAKDDLTIDGGSVAIKNFYTDGAGAVTKNPLTHGIVHPRPRNGSGKYLYRAVFPVGGAAKASISSFTPLYYGTKDLFPADGNLMFWLPRKKAELYCRTKRAMSFYSKKKGKFTATVKKGTYNPVAGSAVQAHDENVFVIWTHVKQSMPMGKSTVKKPAMSVTLPNGTTMVKPSGGGSSSSSKKPSKSNSSSPTSSGRAASTAALSAALASAPPLPTGWVRIKFDANGGATTTHYRDYLATEYVSYDWGSYELNKYPRIGWLPFPKRKGYAFDGWRTKRNGGLLCSQYNLATDTTYYANWTKKSKYVQITFFANGGKVYGKRISSIYGISRIYTTNKKFGEFPSAKRKGYVFVGWYQTSDCLGPKLTTSHIVPAVNSWLTSWYARWAKKKYKVAFFANGGKGKMSAEKFTYGKAKKIAANKFKRNGYAFKGWAKSKALAAQGKVAYKDKKAVKNLVTTGKTVKLYAVWKKK